MSDRKPVQDEGELLVVAMARPAMVGGFTIASIGFSFFIPWFTSMLTRSIWPLVFIPVLIVASYMVCLKDVYLFDIATAATRLKPCANKRHWGCRSYAPR